MDLRNEAMSLAMKKVERETERWCRDAAARGEGWSVWRSDPKFSIGDVTWQFMLVPPGGGHPAGGDRFALKAEYA